MNMYRKQLRDSAIESPQVQTAVAKLHLHPYAAAMEKLELGDLYTLDEDWLSAKSCYLVAVETLEKMPMADRRNLKNGLNRLAYVHLRLFEFVEAFECLMKAHGKSSDFAHPRASEAEAIMENIMAARKVSIDRDREYQPGIYTAHL